MLLLYIFYTLFFVYIVLFVLELILKKRNNYFDTYFGVPGSGKTTVAAWLTKHTLKKKKCFLMSI